MRIVLALTLYVLQFAAGRPPPAPATAPPAAARRGEGALLANGELSDLLRPLLDQLDDTSQNLHKKKRILEIMPITQKSGSRRTPLIILAAEVPPRKLKKDSKPKEGKVQKNNKKHRNDKHKSKNSDESLTTLSDENIESSSELSNSAEEEKINYKHNHKRIKALDESGNSVELSSEENESLEHDDGNSSHENSDLEKLISDLLKHLPQDKGGHTTTNSEEHSKHKSKSDEVTKDIKQKHGKASVSSEHNSASTEIEEESQESNERSEEPHKNTNRNKKHHDDLEVVTKNNDSVKASSQSGEEAIVDESKSIKKHNAHEIEGDKEDATTSIHKDVNSQEKNIPSKEKISSESASKEVFNEISKQVDDTPEFSKEEVHESLSSSDSHEHIRNDAVDSEVESSSAQDTKSVDYVHPQIGDVNESNQEDNVYIYNPEASNSVSKEESAVSSSLDNSLSGTNDEVSRESTHDSVSEEVHDDFTISSGMNIKFGSQETDASIGDPMDGIIKIVPGSRESKPHPTSHYGHVIKNANKGDVKEVQKIYKLSFKFNK